MIRAGVVGASGYSGGELLRILSVHPEVEVLFATSRSKAGQKVHSVHPNLRGFLEIKFEDIPAKTVADGCDVVFTALPHGASMDIVPELLASGVRVIDLSGDFRFKNVSDYEKYYGMHHKYPDINAVYGLPELHREEIKKNRFISNPGCYPTCSILGLAPLLKAGLINPNHIIVDAKSGISGAGASQSSKTHFSLADENVLAYNVTSHRHMPEIEQELSTFQKGIKISFVPHLVPLNRGLTTTIHCSIKDKTTENEIKTTNEEFYNNEPFVRILDVGEIPRLSSVRGSNFCDIGCFKIDEERKRLVVVSAIDNLVKGAAGQAVQNMNIMLNLEETMGLMTPGLHP